MGWMILFVFRNWYVFSDLVFCSWIRASSKSEVSGKQSWKSLIFLVTWLFQWRRCCLSTSFIAILSKINGVTNKVWTAIIVLIFQVVCMSWVPLWALLFPQWVWHICASTRTVSSGFVLLFLISKSLTSNMLLWITLLVFYLVPTKRTAICR